MAGNESAPGAEPNPAAAGIVSVNARGGSQDNPIGKVLFVVGLASLLIVVGLFGFNRYRAARAGVDPTGKPATKDESGPAKAGATRDFDKEQAMADAAAAPPVPGTTVTGKALCADGTAGTEALSPDNKPMLTAQGVALRVCGDGHIIVPNIDGSAPIAVAANAPGATPRPSRYGGEALVPGGSSLPTTDPATLASNLNSLLEQGRVASAVEGALGANGSAAHAITTPSAGSLGSQLTPSATPKVSAAMLGDRNMILPKGRSIDCGLTMRLVNDLAGLASCVLTQNVYSDNGKVLLLERGSEAVGEYGSAMAQGQKRLFVLWTRIKTPSGVVINLDSPGTDELGTSGLPGIVNNHWRERVGAAFLLSFVEDVIGYETARATGANGAGGVAVFQNSSQTGNQMASKVLESTINIKPTLYKNQGDRGSIYVARDLDFSSVYALRTR